jgi:TPP-dependent indolepyruvate ferredoxin oxidoreductase alpha subunit
MWPIKNNKSVQFEEMAKRIKILEDEKQVLLHDIRILTKESEIKESFHKREVELHIEKYNKLVTSFDKVLEKFTHQPDIKITMHNHNDQLNNRNIDAENYVEGNVSGGNMAGQDVVIVTAEQHLNTL